MNVKKLCVLAALMTACLPAFALTVPAELDGARIEQNVEAVPNRAVSLSHFTTEMMLALDLGDHMAGTAFLEEPIYEGLKEKYEAVPVLADQWPSAEVFFGAKPDFALGWATAFTKKGVDGHLLQQRGVPFWVPESALSKDATLDTLWGDFETLGEIFGVQDRAKAYVEEQKAKLATVQEQIGQKEPVKVFVYDSGSDEAFTVFEGFTTSLLKLVGAQNVMSGRGVDKTWGKCSWEEVIAANPEVILVIGYSNSVRFKETDGATKIDFLKNFKPLANVDAVKNNRFVEVSLADLCPGVRNVDALTRIATALYE